MNRLLALAVVLALVSGISCAPDYDCCQTKVVKGAADSSLDGSYELARKEGSPVQSCVDGCVYNKEGEEYCFKECSTGCNHKVDCPEPVFYDTHILLVGGSTGSMEAWNP